MRGAWRVRRQGGDTWEWEGVTSTPTRGEIRGMGGRDEDADKGGIFKRGSGTGRYAQVQTGAPYRVMHVQGNQGAHARSAGVDLISQTVNILHNGTSDI